MFLKESHSNSTFIISGIDWLKKAMDNFIFRIGIFITIVFLLTLSFYNNVFRTVDSNWFKFHQIDSEAYIVARLAESKKNGLSSHSYNLGTYGGGDALKDVIAAGTWIEAVEYQNDIYSGKKEYDNDYKIYNSHVGAQGVFFGVVNKIFGNSLSIENLHFLNSFLSALVLVYFLALIYFEFGLFSGIVFCLGIFLSDWIIVFGRNLYWIIWVIFLPVVINFHYLYKRYNKKEDISLVTWLTVLFIFLLFKFLSGFEYTSTILIAMISPLFYYGIKYKIGLKEFVKLFSLLSFVGIAAFIIAFFIWIWQLYVGEGGDIEKVISIVKFNVFKRTYNIANLDLSPILHRSTIVPWYKVIYTYMGNEFWFSVALFFVFGYFIVTKKLKNFYPLLVATFINFLAPLSWFILGKGHSYIHPQMNFFLWYLTFIPFLWILAAKVVSALFYYGNLRLYFRRNVKKYISLIVLLITIVVAMTVSRREINTILHSNLLSSYENYSIYESNNKIYYVISGCEPYYKINKFFIKFYGKEEGEVFYKEFYFNELKNLSSIYPRHYDFCVAQVELPKFKVDKFDTGQISVEKNIKGWELEVNLRKID